MAVVLHCLTKEQTAVALKPLKPPARVALFAKMSLSIDSVRDEVKCSAMLSHVRNAASSPGDVSSSDTYFETSSHGSDLSLNSLNNLGCTVILFSLDSMELV